MKRIVIAIALAVLVLGTSSVMAAGSSGSSRAASEAKQTSAAPTYDLTRISRLEQICNPRSDGYLRCLNRELTQLKNFVDFFYGCTIAFPVTQYGGGGAGYVYDNGETTFPTTALDYTENTEVDAYKFFSTLRKNCVE